MIASQILLAKSKLLVALGFHLYKKSQTWICCFLAFRLHFSTSIFSLCITRNVTVDFAMMDGTSSKSGYNVFNPYVSCRINWFPNPKHQGHDPTITRAIANSSEGSDIV